MLRQIFRVTVSSYIQHVLPATGFSSQQRLRVSQAGIVNADVHAFVLRFDGCEHGLDVFHTGQVALVWDQDATVACSLTLCRQRLKRRKCLWFYFFQTFG
ncbi:hypothetical protein XENORESO_021436 [Xenotaenia resolanae]|uniref:Uncharacterized protein n=1 Tax=Xenotaenia resolanae TaxID=208358 RepID=A0ABV0VRQ0_9TELE